MSRYCHHIYTYTLEEDAVAEDYIKSEDTIHSHYAPRDIIIMLLLSAAAARDSHATPYAINGHATRLRRRRLPLPLAYIARALHYACYYTP